MKIHQLVRAGHVLLIGLALLVLAGSAQAAFITPSDLATGGWTRGDAGTTYQQWQPYPYAYGAPPVVSQNSAGTATVTATNPAAGTYPAGSGNLYSPAGAPSFVVSVPNFPSPSDQTTVLLQIKTGGSELDYSSVKINGQAANDYQELSRVTVTTPFGPSSTVESMWVFNNVFAGDSFAVTFSSYQHNSLGTIEIDTNTVPEPGTALLVLAGLAGLAYQGRK